MSRAFLFIQLWFTSIATGFYSSWDLGNCLPLMHSSSFHVLSATFSQCRQISIYNKDLLHQSWLLCCQASCCVLGLRRSNEWWVQHLFKYYFFFMLSIDCIWTCFSIINVYENDWMIMQFRILCFQILLRALVFLLSFCLQRASVAC